MLTKEGQKDIILISEFFSRKEKEYGRELYARLFEL